MPTLIYAPEIQVHINTVNFGIIDVSEDLVQWQLILRENAPHTFAFSLQNALRKYDGKIIPNDQITVKLKRLSWLQAFTGLINEVPIFQAFPGMVQLNATCTLKVPQFWYWDPTTQAAQTMILQAANNRSVTNTDTTRAGNGKSGQDMLDSLAVAAMTKVIGWDRSRIHLGQIPKDWFAWAEEVSDLIGADEALYESLKGDFTAAGDYGANVLANLPSGSYGGRSLTDEQAGNASIIYSVCKSMNVPDYVITMALMCSLTESSLVNLTGGDRDSVGLFQQRPSQGWGTVEQCSDPTYATRTFVNRLQGKLKHVRRLSSAMYGMTIQSVQISGFADGSNYQANLGAAEAMVTKLNGLSRRVGSTTPTNNQGNGAAGNGTVIGPSSNSFKASGAQVVSKGLALIAAHKPPAGQYIKYNLGGDNSADTDIGSVTDLDCSSLIDWVYFQSTGLWLSGTRGSRNNVASIQTHCVPISLEAAKSIQGAVLTKGADEHTALSVGNGQTCVAAKTNEAPIAQQVVGDDPIDPNGFDKGWLLPGVDYSQAATTRVAMSALQQVGVNATKLGVQITSPGDPSTIAQTGGGLLPLLTNLVVNPVGAAPLGETLGGPVALINDEPFLPWLQSVINGSMRSFCSAPNGDFIAWFPDYFGIWGSAGKLIIELIELQDFTVKWSDQLLVTHQFVLGNVGLGLFDQASGGIGFGDVASDLQALALGTGGIASFDYPEIFKLIYGKTAPQGYLHAFLKRFGARPDVQQMPMISRGQSEFFMALYLFLQRWASQFTATVPVTFMPEAFPGMLVQIPHYGFQAYVQQVVHSGSYGDGGGFRTDISICAPSNIGGAERNDMLSLLPIGGNVTDAGPHQKIHKKKSKRS